MHEALKIFHPAIGRWFDERLGAPTPPQSLGWPHIAAGQSTLILAPTGSGKTLAAFLTAINSVAARLLANDDSIHGVEILYISPLKSLANDVHRNLTLPLGQIADTAAAMGLPWPEIHVAVRTGDTPQHQRAAMLRNPPHLLITTPESLNLLLTSGGRRALKTVRYVIVDEVHALAGNKRGVFLSLLLERLEQERLEIEAIKGRRKIAPGVYENVAPPAPLIRIGLSATAQPEETIARWLGGYDENGSPRLVSIVRTGQRKRLDLGVMCPFGTEDSSTFSGRPTGDDQRPKSHWPDVTRCVLQLIKEHHSTLVFAGSRRVVERLTAELQEQPDAPAMLPHHGSIDKQVRLATEESLKKGELAAVIATSSLELGIDIGALDLVVQVDSPGSVAAGLQRVGRAGHLEKATAKGRMVARMLAELPAFAALLPLMLEGTVEETHIPENCLDVLAQQTVAACAVRSWRREELFRVFKRSANYHAMAEKQFDAVVAMLSKRTEPSATPSPPPRLSFDRVNDQLIALPATAKIAMLNGGVISDSGQFAVYIADKNVRIGELDEEFVYETKEGDRIVLGSQVWRVQSIDTDRVIVTPAEPGSSRMPFWRGERAPRSLMLGDAIGVFNRQIEQRIRDNADAAREWLVTEHRFDDQAADALVEYYRRQMAHSRLPTDRRIVIEHFRDRAGQPLLAIFCPLGSRVNYALRLALESEFARRRSPVQIIHTDDGVLLRPPGDEAAQNLPENPLAWLRSDTLESTIVEQLEDSPLFGMRFRQNAMRALMLPKMMPTQRTPLWQQRLRARHLLAQVKQQRNFPIIVETYRECLQDTLLIQRARQLLSEIEHGNVEVAVVHGDQPSAMAWALFSSFQQEYLYQWDDPLTASADGPTVDTGVLDQILQRRTEDQSQRPAAWSDQDIATLQRRITGAEYPARTPEELLEKIAAAGAVPLGPPDDPRWHAWAVSDAPAMLRELQESRRLVVVRFPSAVKQNRRVDLHWVATESLGPLLKAMPKNIRLYNYDARDLVPLAPGVIPAAFLNAEISVDEARQRLIENAIRSVPITTVAALQEELLFLRDLIPPTVAALLRSGMIVRIDDEQFALAEYADQLRSIALRRQRKITSTADLSALQNHLLRWHHITEPRSGPDAVEDVLDMLSGVPLSLGVWEYDILPARVADFSPAMLDAACLTGHWVWVGGPNDTISFLPRHLLRDRIPSEPVEFSPEARQVMEYLQKNGASFLIDLEIELPQISHTLAHSLSELVFAGLISNDQLESLRWLLKVQTQTRPASPRNQKSRPSTVRLGGRWFLLPPAAINTTGDSLQIAQRAADRVERLLRRNGFACRELLQPQVDGTWRSCYDVLTRMEWAGIVRRGYFVDGISGSQFALPTVLLNNPPDLPVRWLAMLDPANIWARVDNPWTSASGNAARIPRVPGSWLAVVGGQPVLAAVSWGTRLIPLSPEDSSPRSALAQLGDLLRRLPPDPHYCLTVKEWDTRDIIGSPAEEILRTAGFVRDLHGLRLYRQYGPTLSGVGLPRV